MSDRISMTTTTNRNRFTREHYTRGSHAVVSRVIQALLLPRSEVAP